MTLRSEFRQLIWALGSWVHWPFTATCSLGPKVPGEGPVLLWKSRGDWTQWGRGAAAGIYAHNHPSGIGSSNPERPRITSAVEPYCDGLLPSAQLAVARVGGAL